MSTEHKPHHSNIIPTVVGLLGGAVVMGWLWVAGELNGYAISAHMMLYAIIGGTIALTFVFLGRLIS
jgi:hypothetical protein